jgi:hypothetical protein
MSQTSFETVVHPGVSPAACLRRRSFRQLALGASLAALLSLAACGGGGSDSASFEIGVLIAGQRVGGTQIGPGSSPTISIRAGQSIELDASESVYWTLYVGGSAVSGSGATVYYAGAEITQTAVSYSRIVLDTYAANRLFAPVPITLVATSTYDSAQVATVNVLITN